MQEIRQRLLDVASAESAAWVSENVGAMSLTDLLGSDVSIDIERYTEDVELYLNQWTRTIRTRRDMLLADHAPSHLKLTVRNNTDRNYLAVQVNVFIPGIRSLDHGERRWPPLPAEPAPPVRTRNGPASLFNLFGSIDFPKGLGPLVPYFPDAALATVRKAPEKTLRKSQGPGGVLLEYPELDLRPSQELFLQSVCLDVYDAAVESASVQWDVTAKNADGKLEGTISLPVVNSTLDLSGIFSDTDEREL